jgi:phosphocarrier protein HPr
MTEREVVVMSDAGVHARPAMMIVKEAMKYQCDVKLIKDDVEADCKSIMSVLGLAIVSGSRLIVRASGEGEKKVVETIVAMIENNFRSHEEPSQKN